MYLNEGFEGGSTRFIDCNNDDIYFDFVPKIGSVLIFEHPMLHSGELLTGGRKYSVKSDIIFTKRNAE